MDIFWEKKSFPPPLFYGAYKKQMGPDGLQTLWTIISQISDHFFIFNHEQLEGNRLPAPVLQNGKSNYVVFTGLVRPQIN